MYTDADSRVKWLASHFWDKYLDTTVTSWATDSLNGVKPLDLEKEMGTYATLLGLVSVADGKAAVGRYYSSLQDYGMANPSSAVFREMVRLTGFYLNDPNSPVRNDDLYQSFAAGLAECPLLPLSERERHAWEAQMLDLNHVGGPAADFAYIDINGRRGTLYGVEAEYIVLIFGNPDCSACTELMESMSAIPSVVEMQSSGRLKVVDIYIDEEVSEWRAKADTYPAAWINGYDCESAVNGKHLYHIRAIPSIYLLDASKTVLLKDAPEERLLQRLGSL